MTRLYRAAARRIQLPAVGGLLGVCLALSLLVTPSVEGRAPESGQRPRRPDPETYHWVLPAQHSGVEVVDLHPNDCYAIQRAEGLPEDVVSGKVTDFHEIAAQIKTADLSFKLALEIRNKLVDAYREVMRMNV